MERNRTRRSRAAKPARTLPVKPADARRVGGGASETPTESISFSYGKISIKY